MLVFSQTYTASIGLQEHACKAIGLAAQDLQRDLRRLSGKKSGFDLTCDQLAGIRILTVEGGEAEAYTISVDADYVYITGSDVLGTIYGIYAFCEQCLGVLPMHAFMDVFPDCRQSLTLEPASFTSKPRAVRFRGWFLNDEDLLSELKIGGKRDLDYTFYQYVMHTDVLDLVLEAALRLQINLIIPGSFVDIRNPDEEALVRAVYDRGLYISQHHVEPVGVSYFAAEKYLRERGLDEPISFCSNRKRMEEIWQCYITQWARYADRVIWQLGLRGKGDQAVWLADATAPQDLQDCGNIITDAIATQHSLICRTLGKSDFISTATLWNEGSKMYASGYLQLPQNTIAVFSDFGISQMFGEDFYSTPRIPRSKYGVYYHAAFWSLGPHLTEGCDPRKMEYCYRDAYRLDSLEYSILNVSNVRPIHVSLTLNGQILSSPHCFCADSALRAFHQGVFGTFGDQVYALHRQYYQCFADFGKTPLRQAAQAWHFYYRDHADLPFLENAATDGQIAWVGKNALRGWSSPGAHAQNDELLEKLEQSSQKFSQLSQRLEALEQQLPITQKLYLQRFLGYQTKHMYLLTRWAICCVLMTGKSTPAQHLQQLHRDACEYMHKLLQARQVLENDGWKHWHRGDKKINIPALLNATTEAYTRIITNGKEGEST